MRKPFAQHLADTSAAKGANECWPWPGKPGAAGYGQVYGPMKAGVRKRLYTHRLAYEALVGPIPSGLVIDHLCRNRACMNPAHMEVVTRGVNNLRGVGVAAVLARKTHCNNGHALTGENIRILKGKWRRCRLCEALWIVQRRERRRAARESSR